MNVDQKIEVMKAAVALAAAVVNEGNDLARRVAKSGSPSLRQGDEPVTPLIDHLFRHLCELVGTDEGAGAGRAD